MKDKSITKTIFRKFNDGSIIAMFPEIGTSVASTCSSYMHLGQHCPCVPDAVIEDTKIATPAEYGSLKEELERIGYKIEAIKRLRQSHYVVRQRLTLYVKDLSIKE
jgi:hypothetical protein